MNPNASVSPYLNGSLQCSTFDASHLGSVSLLELLRLRHHSHLGLVVLPLGLPSTDKSLLHPRPVTGSLNVLDERCSDAITPCLPRLSETGHRRLPLLLIGTGFLGQRIIRLVFVIVECGERNRKTHVL